MKKKFYLFLVIITLSSFSTYLFLNITKISDQFYETNISIKFLETHDNLLNLIKNRESFTYFSDSKTSNTAYSYLVNSVVTENLCNRNSNEQLKSIKVSWNTSINFNIFFLEQEKFKICIKKIEKILNKLDKSFLNAVDEYINISNDNNVLKSTDEEIFINKLKKMRSNQSKEFYKIYSKTKKIEKGGVNIILSVFFLFSLFYFIFFRIIKINFIKNKFD